ncbi:hypothetical protein GEV33_013502 [Tenebrio molitor]|uniref:Uncharacterized protein n=1 Tax=Tenebrio molitor TaxID=7067 RepID=A0A8J6H7H5_TENMO|nr:hypothetical protein GEV33_013502 [Tenebrio molitor]
MKIKINTSFRYLDLDKAYTARSQGISSGVSVLFLGSLRDPSAILLAKLHRLIVEVADYLLLTVDLQLMRGWVSGTPHRTVIMKRGAYCSKEPHFCTADASPESCMQDCRRRYGRSKYVRHAAPLGHLIGAINGAISCFGGGTPTGECRSGLAEKLRSPDTAATLICGAAVTRLVIPNVGSLLLETRDKESHLNYKNVNRTGTDIDANAPSPLREATLGGGHFGSTLVERILAINSKRLIAAINAPELSTVPPSLHNIKTSPYFIGTLALIINNRTIFAQIPDWNSVQHLLQFPDSERASLIAAPVHPRTSLMSLSPDPIFPTFNLQNLSIRSRLGRCLCRTPRSVEIWRSSSNRSWSILADAPGPGPESVEMSCRTLLECATAIGCSRENFEFLSHGLHSIQ